MKSELAPILIAVTTITGLVAGYFGYVSPAQRKMWAIVFSVALFVSVTIYKAKTGIDISDLLVNYTRSVFHWEDPEKDRFESSSNPTMASQAATEPATETGGVPSPSFDISNDRINSLPASDIAGANAIDETTQREREAAASASTASSTQPVTSTTTPAEDTCKLRLDGVCLYE